MREIVDRIRPFDEQEQAARDDVLAWVESGADLYRRQKPDVPAKHLVAYFVLVDGVRRSMLLVHHKKAGLWVPTGGHVEPEEDPRAAAVRELEEELGSRAALVASVAALPLFVTLNVTRGAGTHTDVCLWYVVAGDEHMWLEPDPREFTSHRWLTFDEVLATDIDELEPALHRFVHKLQGRV